MTNTKIPKLLFSVQVALFLVLILVKTFSGFLILGNETSFLTNYFFSTTWLDSVALVWMFLPVIAISVILAFIHETIAFYFIYVTSIVFLTCETVLTFFTVKSGFLIGRELLFRSAKELTTTIWSSGYLMSGIAVLIIVILLFVLFAKYIYGKLADKKLWLLLPAINILVLFFSSFKDADVRRAAFEGKNQYNYTVNKTVYLGSEIFRDIKERSALKSENTFVEYDENKIESYLQSRNLFTPLDYKYPLERNNDAEDVLSNYFEFDKSKKPNIIFIIVESLGSDYSGKYTVLPSFTPFLDSLAANSLYWPNCLVTTQRTFGALPSVLGSLPHGNNGFQFGMMPNHSSIIKICGNNRYHTSFMYAGAPDFDCMDTFLEQQNINYISPYFAEYLQSTDSPPMWGYDDKILFRKSLTYLNTNQNKPHCTVFLTTTTHDQLHNKEKETYIEKAKKINNDAPVEKRVKRKDYLNYFASFVYADDAIREFMTTYLKEPKNKNTIFIITGDHSTELYAKNELVKYRVPLIIYSPLLKKYHESKAIVSSLDITPTLITTLENNNFIKKSKSISWLGQTLDTFPEFRHKRYNLFMLSNRRKAEYCQGNYFYTNGLCYQFDSLLNFKKVVHKEIINRVKEGYDLATYMDDYVYTNNRILSKDYHTLFFSSIYSVHKTEPVLVNDTVEYSNWYKRAKHSKGFTKIRITVSGKIKLDKYNPNKPINLVIECNSDGLKGVQREEVDIKKIVQGKLKTDHWLPFKFGRVFDVSEGKELNTIVYFWNPEREPDVSFSYKDYSVNVDGY